MRNDLHRVYEYCWKFTITIIIINNYETSISIVQREKNTIIITYLADILITYRQIKYET
jgi:hypothetical protein